MSRWFINHRQQFIADCLRIYGQVNRATLMDRFDISAPQASADIGLFMRENPDATVYDGTAKAYVVNVAALSPPGSMCEGPSDAIEEGSSNASPSPLEPTAHSSEVAPSLSASTWRCRTSGALFISAGGKIIAGSCPVHDGTCPMEPVE